MCKVFFFNQIWEILGIPWWSTGYDSVLSLSGLGFESLIGELSSYKLHRMYLFPHQKIPPSKKQQKETNLRNFKQFCNCLFLSFHTVLSFQCSYYVYVVAFIYIPYFSETLFSCIFSLFFSLIITIDNQSSWLILSSDNSNLL